MALCAKPGHLALKSCAEPQHFGAQCTAEQGQHPVVCVKRGLLKGHFCGANLNGRRVGCWRTFVGSNPVIRRDCRLNRCRIQAAISSEQPEKSSRGRLTKTVTTQPVVSFPVPKQLSIRLPKFLSNPETL